MSKAKAKKGVIETAIDAVSNAVDHALHPDHGAQDTSEASDAATQPEADKAPVKSRKAAPQFEGHPKFDKFN